MSTPTPTGLRRFEPVSDAVILVALDRAERHEPPNPWRETGAPWFRLVQHLGFAHNSWTTRKLRPQVEALIDAGLLIRVRNAGRVRWGLTDAGAIRVAQLRLDDEVVLPLSPQRRQWQRARSEAAEQIEGIRERLGSELRDALKQLDRRSGSVTWYRTAEDLHTECRRLGGATFCLHEWEEPDDEHPNSDNQSAANQNVRHSLSALRLDTTKKPGLGGLRA